MQSSIHMARPPNELDSARNCRMKLLDQRWLRGSKSADSDTKMRSREIFQRFWILLFWIESMVASSFVQECVLTPASPWTLLGAWALLESAEISQRTFFVCRGGTDKQKVPAVRGISCRRHGVYGESRLHGILHKHLSFSTFSVASANSVWDIL